MRNKSSLPLFTAPALVVAWAVLLWSGASALSGPLNGPFGQTGTSLVLTGSSPRNSVTQRCALEDNKEYAVEFDAAATGPAHFTAGFWSRSQERPVQTFSVLLGNSGDMVRVRGVLNSGAAARDLELRISCDWRGRWMVRNLRVRRNSPTRFALAWLALAVAVVITLLSQYRWLISRPGARELILKAVKAVPGSVPWPAAMIGVIVVSCFIRDLAYTHPFVFGDEGEFALLSKFATKPALLAGNQVIAPFPNALYFHVYRAAFYFGENFVTVAKLLNALFWGIGLFAIYGVLRRFLTQGRSAFAIAVIGIGPISVYGALFMPEMMHFCMFSVMAYILVTRMDSRVWPAAAMAGIALGADILVKPHGLLLVLPVVVTLALLKPLSGSDVTWQACAKGIAAFLASTAASAAGLSVALTGEVISGVGRFYGPMVGRTVSNHSNGAVSLMMGSHFGALCSLYALPLSVIAAALLLRSAFLDRLKTPMLTLLLLTTTTLVTLLFTTSKFTVAIAVPGTLEYANRLHGRYYFFLLPWILASFFAVYPAMDRTKLVVRRVFTLCLVVTAVISLYAVLRSSQSAFMFFPDFPEIFWFYAQHSGWRFVVLGLTLGTLTVYAIRSSCPSLLFGLSFGVLGLIGTVWTTQYLLELPPTSGDEAAAVFSHLIAPDARDNGAVIVSDDSTGAEFYRLLFHMPEAYDLVVDRRNGPVTLSDLAGDKSWVIVVGEHETRFPHMDSVSIGRYTLYANPGGVNSLYSATKAPEGKSAVLSDVPKDASAPLFNIDYLGAEGQLLGSTVQKVRAHSTLYISGWALDQKNNVMAGAVSVVLDRLVYPARYGIERPDVAAYFHNSGFARAGFTVSINGTAMTPGRHTLRVRVFATDYSVFWESAAIVFQAR